MAFDHDEIVKKALSFIQWLWKQSGHSIDRLLIS
jgi:hypothetical protein